MVAEALFRKGVEAGEEIGGGKDSGAAGEEPVEEAQQAVASDDWVREYCLALAGATEQVQWGDDLVFKAGGKMFAVMPLEPTYAARRSGGQAGGKLNPKHVDWPWLSFKTTPEEFAELTERPGVRPAA